MKVQNKAFLLLLSGAILAPSALGLSPAFATEHNVSSNATTATATNNSTAANATAAGENAIDAAAADFVANVEQIRGHLQQALSNKEAGNETLAQAHALHPIEESYAAIQGLLENENSRLNELVGSTLNETSAQAANATAEEFAVAVENTDAMLDYAVLVVVPPEQLNSTSFNATAIAHLLDIAGHHYEGAGVQNGTITQIVEYQDAQAFISQAGKMFNSTAGGIDPAMAHKVEEVQTFFSHLGDAVQNRFDLAGVETMIGGIIHELSGITGIAESQLVGQEAEAGSEQEPVQFIENVRSLLDQVMQAYREQQYEKARSLAIEAYLENFEFVEAPLAEHDAALMKETEIMLREELRQLIDDRAPAEQIQQHINSINSNLDRAEELLSR
jgi:hypothetical protein